MIICKSDENGVLDLTLQGDPLALLMEFTVVLRGIKKFRDEISEKVECKPFQEVIACLIELSAKSGVGEMELVNAVLKTELDIADLKGELQS